MKKKGFEKFDLTVQGWGGLKFVSPSIMQNTTEMFENHFYKSVFSREMTLLENPISPPKNIFQILGV